MIGIASIGRASRDRSGLACELGGNLVVRVWLRGGLGNQLFQYSAGLYLSKVLDEGLVLRSDLLPESADSFGGVSRWPEQISTFAHLGTVHSLSHQPPFGTSTRSKIVTLGRAIASGFPDQGLFMGMIGDRNLSSALPGFRCKRLRRDLDLNGYFLDSRIPLSVSSSLRESLRAVSSPHLNLAAERLRVRDAVAIHLRLGDHSDLDGQLIARLTSQIRKAIELLGLPAGARLALFSDDTPIALEMVESLRDFEILLPNTEGMTPVEIMNLIAGCEGLIAGVGTFAWWSAFLMDEPSQVVFMDTQKLESWSQLSMTGWRSLQFL